jgi:hypothetical protein
MNNLIFQPQDDYRLEIEHTNDNQAPFLRLYKNDESIVGLQLISEDAFDRACRLKNYFNKPYDRDLIIKHLKNFSILGCRAYSDGNCDWTNLTIKKRVLERIDMLSICQNKLQRFVDTNACIDIINSYRDLNVVMKRGSLAGKTKLYVDGSILPFIYEYNHSTLNQRKAHLTMYLKAKYLDSKSRKYIAFDEQDLYDCYVENGQEYYRMTMAQIYELNLSRCNDCGNYYEQNYTHFHNNERVCNSCHTPLQYSIQNYDYTPNLHYIVQRADGKVYANTRANFDNNIYFGIELEVELKNDCKLSRLEIVNEILKNAKTENNKDMFYVVEDGSLNNGFEIVSYPMTYKAIQAIDFNALIFRYRKYVKSFNTNTCGMHTHVSKNAFSNLNAIKAMKIVYSNYEFTRFIAQRKSEDLNRWSPIRPRHFDRVKSSIIENKNDVHANYRKYVKALVSSKYHAMNFSKSHTIEFRIFKGNLVNHRFLKNIEFIQALIDYTKVTPYRAVNINTFVGFVKSNYAEYQNLNKFLNEFKNEFKNVMKGA